MRPAVSQTNRLFATFELTGLFVLSPAVPDDSSNLKGKASKKPFGESVASSESPPRPDGQSQMDRSGEIKRLLAPSSKEEVAAAVCPPPDDSQSVAVYYNYERARPAAQLISKSTSEFQQKQQHLYPSRENPSGSTMDPSSEPDAEIPTNQSTSEAGHLASAQPSVASELPFSPPWSIHHCGVLMFNKGLSLMIILRSICGSGNKGLSPIKKYCIIL